MRAGLGLIQLILCLSDLDPILLILRAYMDLRPTGVCSLGIGKEFPLPSLPSFLAVTISV